MIDAPAFRAFLDWAEIPAHIYDQHWISNTSSIRHVPHRYFIRNPFLTESATSATPSDDQLLHELGNSCRRVPWFPDFYCIDGAVKLNPCPSYQQGAICGLDITSGLAVQALDLHPDDHVLDLCCAPGAKLVYIASQLHRPDQGWFGAHGSVTGVDISKHRLSTCRSLVKKYHLPRVRLVLDDGTRFDVHAPQHIEHIMKKSRGEGSQLSCSLGVEHVKLFHATKLMKQDTVKNSGRLYDKVIVDAECTHDGSIIHLLKQSDGKENQSKFLNSDRLREIEPLQRGLIQNGFRLLKPGGTLIYSTCSFSPRQNHDIVLWLLANEPSARLEVIPMRHQWPQPSNDALIDLSKRPLRHDLISELSHIESADWLEETMKQVIEHTAAFSATFLKQDDEEWWTSGFYIARIGKAGPC